MGKARGEFTDVLIKKGLLGADQLAEAKVLQQQTGAKIQDALIKLEYVSPADLMAAMNGKVLSKGVYIGMFGQQ